jgi:uncharacterized protein (DUF2249 family)
VLVQRDQKRPARLHFSASETGPPERTQLLFQEFSRRPESFTARQTEKTVLGPAIYKVRPRRRRTLSRILFAPHNAPMPKREPFRAASCNIEEIHTDTSDVRHGHLNYDLQVVPPAYRHRAVFHSQMTSPNKRRFTQPLTRGNQIVTVPWLFIHE